MPANLKDLRTRIKSVKSTQQITKAMKLVSAAKFGRAQTHVVNSRPYATALSRLMAKIAGILTGGCRHPLMNVSSSKNAVLLVFSSDRGLCGGYNANVSKHALKAMSELEQEGFRVFVVCVGRKSFQAFLRRHRLSGRPGEAAHVSEREIVSDSDVLLNGSGLTLVSGPFNKPDNQNAKNLSDALGDLYTKGKIGRLVVVYNKFQSAMVQTPTADTVLPLKIFSQEAVAEPIFEPEVDELLDHVLPRYMVSRIYQTLLEAVASEHGARMTAMDNATRNARDMEKKLQTTYQRARQAAITNELIEIISGAEAL